MNIVFMGTPDFAQKSLDRLLKDGYKINAVVTQPDRPRGRGNKIQPSSVKRRAEEAGITVLQPESVKSRDFIEALKCLCLDIIVVVAYGHILPKEILELPLRGCINVHASLLPEYRGAAPINRCIIDGKKESGITTIYMDEGMDTGDILLQKPVKIGVHETAGQLHDRLAAVGALLLTQTLEGIKKDCLPRRAQDHSKATYAPPLSKDTGKADWTMAAQSIYNLIRGTNPWPGCYTYYKMQRMKLWDGRVLKGHSSGVPGEIIKAGTDGLTVQTGKGRLLLTEIQMPSSKKMTAGEYLRGNPVKVGSVLSGEIYV